MKITKFWRRLLLVLLSILLLSMGWLGGTGLGLLVALVPLLLISSEEEDSRRGWWVTFGWALLTFVGWNLASIWWIGYSTPVGPVAATLVSSLYSMVAFMSYHTVSKRASRALAYTLLVSLWIALEYYNTNSDVSWPWLLLGNGFSNDIWAIQWYEFTGIFGGSLWVLISNILIFEAIKARRVQRRAVLFALFPLVVSASIFLFYQEEEGEKMEISIIQPNVDAYEKFAGSEREQEENLIALLKEVPSTTKLIVMPETAMPRSYEESSLGRMAFISRMRETMRRYSPEATLICGVVTVVRYPDGERSPTSRWSAKRENYYDNFNTVFTLPASGAKLDLRHKAKLVIGVESTPTWIFKLFEFLVIDLGGIVGQLGVGTTALPFDVDGVEVGAAVCYEGLYGEFFSGFVADGAEVMTIISNDGWWGDTPGHRHLYSLSSVRAVETRRSIARSANTGTSGFINSRGDSLSELGWEEHGVLSAELTLGTRKTLYVLWGDYIARIAVLLAGLSILYYIGYRARKRQMLVE